MSVSNSLLGRDWKLDQVPAVGDPTHMVQIDRNHRVFTGEGQRRVKCAWTFNVPYVFFPGVSKWKLQGEWSNVAYTAGTGYPNAQGQNDCLDGHRYSGGFPFRLGQDVRPTGRNGCTLPRPVGH